MEDSVTPHMSPIIASKQGHHHMKVAMLLLSISVIIQSMVTTGAFNVCISTIEKLYQYNSFHVAFIDIFYNFGFAVGAFTIGYMIINQKMRWIGFGMFLITVGCALFILPVFMIKQIKMDKFEISYLCNREPFVNNLECRFGSYIYLVVMCLAYFIVGVGASPLHTVAVNFIQENTGPREGGLFVGIYYTCITFGPAILFVIYSFIIKVPLMIKKDPNDITTHNDENWIGAYWIVYVLGSILSLIVSIPMILFPPVTKIVDVATKSGITFGVGKFLLISKKVILNKGFVFVTLALLFDGMMNNAIGVFLSKYIEAQFSLTTDKAAVSSGFIIVLGAAIGLSSGGLFIKLSNWSNKRLIRVIASISALGILAAFFLFFHCPENPIKGVVYKNKKMEFVSKLAADCKCDFQQFLPVCVDKKHSYYSPCIIGCKTQSHDGTSYIFTNCLSNSTSQEVIKQGRCGGGCKVFPIFMITGFIFLVVEFFIYAPLITYTMRILEDDCRLLGLSLQQIIVRMSLMLGPLYQGRFFDMSCTMFNPVLSCKKASNCIDYNLKYLSLSIALPAILQKSLSTVCLVLAAILQKSVKTEIQEKKEKLSYISPG